MRSRRKEFEARDQANSGNVAIAGVGVKTTGNDCWQKFDTEPAKKLHYRIERIDFPQFEKQNDLRTLTGMGKTVPDQPIHDRARSKPEVIDEAGTSGAEAQTISPLPQHAQVWLRVSTKSSRTKIGAQRRMTNQNLRRDTNTRRKGALPRKEKKNVQNSFQQKSGEWEHERAHSHLRQRDFVEEELQRDCEAESRHHGTAGDEGHQSGQAGC